MSVFNDFQRLWMQRFPQSSLSNAWEQDVRASLERHKQKISELSKELEQETLYVEYLERLLSDVDKFRESGGDPTSLFEAATTTNTTTRNTTNTNTNTTTSSNIANVDNNNATHSETGSDDDAGENVTRKSSLNLREANDKKDKSNNRLSLNTDNKYTSNATGAVDVGNGGSGAGSGGGGGGGVGVRAISAKTSPTIEEHSNAGGEAEDKDTGTEKSEHGALQQCISELAAANARTTVGPAGADEHAPERKASHFVTVIEVKESKSNLSASDRGDAAKSTPSHSGAGGDHHQGSETTATSTTTHTSFSSFDWKQAKQEANTAPPLSPALTSPSMSASSYTAHLDAKKKMPPRPPPKNMRRVEPPTIPGALSSSPKRDTPFSGSTIPLPPGGSSSSDSAANSLERNVKPSELLRQKAADASTEPKNYAVNRKTTPDLGKLAPEIMEEFGRKIGKSESLEKSATTTTTTKRVTSDIAHTDSPTGSLGRNGNNNATSAATARSNVGTSPTSSLLKNAKLVATDSSSMGSLEKRSRTSLQPNDAHTTTRGHAGSKESLASQGISEIVKSYESVSSLGSDSAKAGAQQVPDNEPYYDTVPLDNGEGEYVYIKPGGTGSSSSRDDLSTPGSTLPMGTAAHLSSQTSVTDPESPGRTSNYVNIAYFLHQSNETRSSSLDSDGEYDGPAIMRTISHDEQQTSTIPANANATTTQTPNALRKVSSNARGAKIRQILSTIIQSETAYVECLNKMIQYKKAIHASLGTSQPVIKQEEENTIFFKIDELHEVHTQFLADLQGLVAYEVGDVLIGETFKRLAEMFNLYSSFLHNYGQAIETVKKCSANNPQFKKIVSQIVLNTRGSLPLEDLLHKPVARVQINASVFDDLLNETPVTHPDYQPLLRAQKSIHVFLKQFNVVNQSLPSESNKNLRRMVKNSFIVELMDGHRKLRHLFLFNDVIACAKHKASGRDRIEYELKWFIPLKDVFVHEESESQPADLKESSPPNILQLKTQACTVRDQLLAEEKDDKTRKTNGVRAGDKYRRKLADLESQLVLASPNLVFRLTNKATNKTFTFFLSSDFERTQWIDSILALKETCNIPGASTINAMEVHSFIIALQKSMKTEMGSYLMRNTNDENLLIGDLHLTVHGLSGLEQSCDVYVCIEIDSYGHYFRKATTKIVSRSLNPVWNESFVLELEGSQNVRILLYEAHERPRLKSREVLKLSRSWLHENPIQREIKLGETLTLSTTFRFVPGEVTLRRVPTSKPGALFGAKMSQVLKREKRDIPFIISACIREVERRGMSEVGIYRVSGSSSDLAKLKKSFETNAYEAEQLLKDVDIHSVTGILKSYLRELPEALFSDLLYPKFFETFSAYSNTNESARITELLKVFDELPPVNKASINHILDHLIRVHHQEADNKMSLHNLAMVFGPTLLRPGQTQTKQKDLLASSTVDVMAQAGILYCFLQGRIKKE